MIVKDIIKLGTKVAGTLDSAIALLPEHDQRVMKEFFKFLDKIDEEKLRADSDHDDLIVWKMRKDKLLSTTIEELRRKRKK